ncbi:hypothetical protein [Lactobacillus helveticus]|uniref:hypothetical protein n=1 Tax=Lactobacillus helveticus TaxID=1587 RepID=UPI0030D51492
MLVTFDLKKDAKSIEQELVTVFMIFDQDHLFIGSTTQVIEIDTDNLKIIFANLFNQLDHINQKLNTVKQKIDYLDSVARETTKTKELKKVTDLTRELVYLKHTLDDQTESLRSFGKYLEKNQLASSADITSLMTKQS